MTGNAAIIGFLPGRILGKTFSAVDASDVVTSGEASGKSTVQQMERVAAPMREAPETFEICVTDYDMHEYRCFWFTLPG